jgi:hypothetical protein
VKGIALAASLLATLVLSAPAGAVDNGVPDGDRHPNVGLLGFDLDAGGPSPPYFFCTGMVLSDRAFLTAAHCITAFEETVQWVASVAPGGPASPAYTPGVVFDDFPFAVRVPVERPVATIVHPQFDAVTHAHDLAVLVFARGTFGVRPVELPRPRLLDKLRPAGTSFTLVGYGADPDYGLGEPHLFAPGYRQTATAPFLALTSRQLLLQGAGDSGRGGLCLGDSGSPQLLGNVAVSLLSAVGKTCREIVAQRLDLPADRGFLARFAHAAISGAAEAGTDDQNGVVGVRGRHHLHRG